MPSFLQLILLSGLLTIARVRLPVDRHAVETIVPSAFSDSSFSFIDPTVTTDSSICIIPFSRAGNLIMIKARADTTEGNFVLDTGAPGLILNLTYFRSYNTIANATDVGESGGITGEANRSNPTLVPEFSFGGVRYSGVEADRINLGHIEDSKGVKILGLLGMQLFKRFEMIIDYEKGLIYLHLITKKESSTYQSEQLADTSTYTTFPITITENKLLTMGEMEGKKLTFIIDTGAESNVLDSRLPDRIFENFSVSRRILLTGAGNKKIEALYGDARNLKLGKLAIGTLPMIVTNLEKLCFSYDKCIDGMLGFDFLSLHKIGFNFVKSKMYIWK